MVLIRYIKRYACDVHEVSCHVVFGGFLTIHYLASFAAIEGQLYHTLACRH